MNVNNIDNVYNHYKRLLADKHNAKRNKLNKVVTLALLKDKRTHLNTVVKECFVFYDSKEYLRRFYCKKESTVRIPKFAVYYKDYLKYFCKAMIKDLIVNKVLMRNMEKIAQDFYYNNYQKGNELKDCNNNNKKELKRCSPRRNCIGSTTNKFFDKRVVNEIEKGKYGDNVDSKRNNNNNKFNLLKHSISNQNISSISRILPITSNNNHIDTQSNDSLMESILLSLETKQQTQIPKTNNNNNNNKPNTHTLSTLNNNNNIKHHKTSFPSSLTKTKSTFKISNNNNNNITSTHPSKDILPNASSTTNNLYHSTQFKHSPNKLKVYHHSNSNTSSNTKAFHSQQQHKHPFTQVVYQYQKYRFNSCDKASIPPNIIPSPNTITIASPKHSIHLLSVSPSTSHQKIWSPHSHNTNKTSYQRFMLQNKNAHLNRMTTSSTITNTLMHASPTGIKIKSKTKLSFNNNCKQTYTRMKSFSLRNSIGIDDNLNGGVVVIPNNYRKGNKGGYLYGSVTSLYKRDFKTIVKGENVKTNRHDASKTYNTTLRMSYNGCGKYSN